MGRAATAERLEVRWPSGLSDIVENIQANQILTLEEKKGVVARQLLHP
jgi:hypothetical protein